MPTTTANYDTTIGRKLVLFNESTFLYEIDDSTSDYLYYYSL